MFPDDDTAREWFENKIWPDGPNCPYCGSLNVQSNIKHKTMAHRCRDCENRPMFSLKTGNVMEGTKLSYQTWAIAIYLVTTSLKGVSSMKLHRDLGITQKSAWHLAHQLREAYKAGKLLFSGPVEVDETYIGGKEKKKLRAGRGAVGKAIAVGARDRDTKRVSTTTVKGTDRKTLHTFVGERVAGGSTVYTDDHKAYPSMKGVEHETVRHSVGEYVNGMAHTNGIESFWAMLKRGYHGT